MSMPRLTIIKIKQRIPVRISYCWCCWFHFNIKLPTQFSKNTPHPQAFGNLLALCCFKSRGKFLALCAWMSHEKTPQKRCSMFLGTLLAGRSLAQSHCPAKTVSKMVDCAIRTLYTPLKKSQALPPSAGCG